MRPIYIRLKGFLSFYHETLIPLQDSRLWIVFGPNGSGKSAAITDGITFPLFGYARGQKRPGSAVIHDRCDMAEAEFVFELGTIRWRALRKISRKGDTGSEQECFLEWFDASANKWNPVPNTRKVSEFDSFVDTYLRLKLEPFLCYAMLLQGRTAELLESKPTELRKYLMQITSLEPYRLLGEHTTKAANRASDRTKDLTTQIEGYPEVPLEEMEAAQRAVEEAEKRFHAAEAARALAVEDLARAKDRARLERDRERAQTEASQAEEISANIEEVREAVSISESAFRQKMAVGGWLRMKKALEQTIQDGVEARRTAEELGERYRVLEQGVKDAKAALETARERYIAKDRQVREARIRSEAAQAQKHQAENYHRVEADRKRIVGEIEGLDAALMDLPSLDALMNSRSAISELKSSVDLLERAIEERNNARVDVQEAKGRLVLIQKKAEEATQMHARREAEAKASADREAQAQETLLTRRGEIERLEATLQARNNARGEAACPSCGRDIDQHTLEELEREILELEERITHARAAATAAQADLERMKEEKRSAERAEKEAMGQRERVLQEVATMQQHIHALEEKEKERHKTAAGAWKRALDLAQPAGIEAPDPRSADGKDVLKNRLAEREMEIAREEPRWRVLSEKRGQRTSLAKTLQEREIELAALPRPAKALEAVQEEAEAAQNEYKALESHLEEIRAEGERLREKSDQISATAQKTLSESEAARGKADTLEKQRERREEEVAVLWKDALESGWTEEREPTQDDLDQLVELARPLEALKRQLQAAEGARKKLDELHTKIQVLDQEFARVADAKPLGEAQEAADRTQEALVAVQAEIQRVSAHLQALRSRSETRARLLAERDALDVEAARLKRLVEPLGKAGLQARLVHSTLGQILESANDVLGRISNDSLRLILDLGESDDDFRVLVEDALSPERPKEFQYISGGQKFRVAISMAIGIGQYLTQRSGSHKLEFMVIDEGFGALNEEAIDDVLDEIERISHDVGTVIVVSHNPRIQAFFPDGYEVTRDAESARVRRHFGGVNAGLAA